MTDVEPRAVLLPFPEGPRLRRERTLDVAAKLIPVLQEALDAGNATLIRELFAVLGEVARGGEAYALLAAIEMKDGELVALRRSEVGRRIDAILADVPAFKAKLEAEVRAEYPDISDAAIAAGWGQMASQMGLEEG